MRLNLDDGRELPFGGFGRNLSKEVEEMDSRLRIRI